MFYPIDAGFLFVLERVKALLSKNKVRNIRLELATEIELHQWLVERKLDKLR